MVRGTKKLLDKYVRQHCGVLQEGGCKVEEVAFVFEELYGRSNMRYTPVDVVIDEAVALNLVYFEILNVD